MATLEKEIERKLVGLVKQTGGLCLKWVCPGWAGVPDRIVLLPGGKLIFVELKRPKGGRLSKQQIWWGEKLMSLGFHWCVVCNDAGLTAFRTILRDRLSVCLEET